MATPVGKLSRIVTDLPAEIRTLLAERQPNDVLGRTKLKKLLDDMLTFNPSLLLAYGYGSPTAKVEVEQKGTMTVNVALAQFNGMPPDELRGMLDRVKTLKSAKVLAVTNGVSGNGNGKGSH